MSQQTSGSFLAFLKATSWTWVVIGVSVGAFLLVTLVPLVRNLPPRPDVAVLVGILTFGLMGVLVAFKSPGATVVEATVAGILLATVALMGIRLVEGVEVSFAYTVSGLVAVIALSSIGGWAGEFLQGTYRADASQKLQWPWIAVGTLLGVLLSVYAVFVPRALWGVGGLGILGFFSGSFFLAAFFVGYFSPGVTIVEPALSAIFIIVIDTALASLGFRAPFPLPAILIAMACAFIIALVGGYVGEVVHNLHFRAAWGDEEGVFKEAAKPGRGA